MSEPIYHLALRSDWERAPDEDYCVPSLATEGFIHCSLARQVAWAANRFYTDAEGLLVLTLDPGRLSSPVKLEPAANDVFPHIYGPINRQAVVAATELTRGPDGRWWFPLAPETA